MHSASSGTSTPTFPLTPTAVALATDYMSVKSKAAKKVQGLAAAQAAVDARPYKAKRASTTAKPPRDGAANAKKRPRLPPPPLPPPSPPLGPPDRHLAQGRPILKRVKNSAFQLEQALVRNAILKAKAQADVCGGLKVTTSSVFDMTAHLLYPFLQAMKEGKLGGITSAFDADSKVVLSGSKKSRVAEIMAWFSRHGVTEFSLQGNA